MRGTLAGKRVLKFLEGLKEQNSQFRLILKENVILAIKSLEENLFVIEVIKVSGLQD